VHDSLWLFAVHAVATVVSIVDPFGAAPIFIGMTPHDPDAERRRQARLASFVCCGVLIVFAVLGNRIFEFFGISTAAFRVAGGSLLLLVALDMLRARESPTRQTPEERREGLEKSDVSITPLGIPLLAGPGAISTVALLGSRAEGGAGRLPRLAILVGAILLVSLLTWFVLSHAARVVRWLGPIGVRLVTRIMGLLLAGIAAEFILGGAREFWIG
jgi:multiple antibiotic resistance protein